MALIDDFLENVTDECGNKMDFSNIEVDGFSGILCFGEDYADVQIEENNFYMYNHFINKAQYKMILSFVEYVQEKMKDHRQISEDDIKTKNSLYNWGKF